MQFELSKVEIPWGAAANLGRLEKIDSLMAAQIGAALSETVRVIRRGQAWRPPDFVEEIQALADATSPRRCRRRAAVERAEHGRPAKSCQGP